MFAPKPIVPLSRQAVEVLASLWELRGWVGELEKPHGKWNMLEVIVRRLHGSNL